MYNRIDKRHVRHTQVNARGTLAVVQDRCLII